MWDDLSLSVKIGIGAIILMAVVAIVMGVYTVSKNTANDGVVGLQDAIGSFNNSKFEDFNQRVISGSQVTSAYNTFNGSPYAIIVKTCKGEWVDYNALVSPFKVGDVDQAKAPFKGITKDTQMQYNVSDSFFTTTSDTSDPIALVLNPATNEKASSTVAYNNSTARMFKQGDTNYVPPTAKFNAYLVYDAGDTLVGMVFIQQGKHTVGS